MAAKRLGTFLSLPSSRVKRNLDSYRSHLMPRLPAGLLKSRRGLKGYRLVEISWSEDWEERLKAVRKHLPFALISVHLPMEKGVRRKALALARAGVSIIHLEANYGGRAMDEESTPMKDGIRSVHRAWLRRHSR